MQKNDIDNYFFFVMPYKKIIMTPRDAISVQKIELF